VNLLNFDMYLESIIYNQIHNYFFTLQPIVACDCCNTGYYVNYICFRFCVVIGLMHNPLCVVQLGT